MNDVRAYTAPRVAVYAVNCDVDSYQILVPEAPEDFDGGNLWINGSLKLSSWNPPQLDWSEPESGLSVPDIAYISPGFYAFNERAIEALDYLLAEYGELLELTINGERWNAFNPTTERDCLDQEQTEWKIRRNGDRGRLISPVFSEEDIEGAVIFQIPETIRNAFYVTDTFVESVKAHELTGLDFHPQRQRKRF